MTGEFGSKNKDKDLEKQLWKSMLQQSAECEEWSLLFPCHKSRFFFRKACSNFAYDWVKGRCLKKTQQTNPSFTPRSPPPSFLLCLSTKELKWLVQNLYSFSLLPLLVFIFSSIQGDCLTIFYCQDINTWNEILWKHYK